MTRRGPRGPVRQSFTCVRCGETKPRREFLYESSNGTVAKRCAGCRRPTRATRDVKTAAFVVQRGVRMTDVEVGAALGITRQRVQQIEAAAMRKLKVTAPWLVDMLRAS